MDKTVRLSRSVDRALVASWTFWLLLGSPRLLVMRPSQPQRQHQCRLRHERP